MSYVGSQKRSFPSHWLVVSFDEAFEDMTSGNTKIKMRDYMSKGTLPVIDQGRTAVAGYVGDMAVACRAPLPCILFGDHSTIVKYASQPFALGADGVKVLVPRPGFDARFAFHYLQTIRLPEGLGYSRHFKYLRQAIVPRPPLAEQRRIADTLDKAEAIRRKRKEAIALSEELLRSAFLEMFGDPVTNPRRWPVKRLKECLAQPLQNGAYFPKEGYSATSGRGTEMVHMADAFNGIVMRGHLKRVEIDARKATLYGLDTRDILVARRSLNYEGSAKPCLIPESSEPLIFESSLIRVTPNPKVLTSLFLYAYLSNDRVRKQYVLPNVTQSTISGINQAGLERVEVMLPSLTAQQQFGKFVAHSERCARTLKELFATTGALFDSLLARAFSGHLTTEGPC